MVLLAIFSFDLALFMFCNFFCATYLRIVQAHEPAHHNIYEKYYKIGLEAVDSKQGNRYLQICLIFPQCDTSNLQSAQ